MTPPREIRDEFTGIGTASGRLYHRRVKLNLCARCGGPKEEYARKNCEACMGKERIRLKEYYINTRRKADDQANGPRT